MVRVEQTLSTLAQGLLQVLAIQRYHVGVVVGLTQLALIIQLVQLLTQHAGTFLAVMNGLAAATHAAAGAGHDFYEIIMHLAGLQILDETASITKAAYGAGA